MESSHFWHVNSWITLKVYLTQMFGCSDSNKMISMIMMWFLRTKENSGQNYSIFQLFTVKYNYILRILIAWHELFVIRTHVLSKIFISSFSTSFTSNYILRVLMARHEFWIFIFFCLIWTLERISFVKYRQNVTILRWIINVCIVTWLAFWWQDV